MDPRKHGLHESDRRKDRSLRPDVLDSTSLRLGGEATSPGPEPTRNGAEGAGECRAPGDDLYQDVVDAVEQGDEEKVKEAKQEVREAEEKVRKTVWLRQMVYRI